MKCISVPQPWAWAILTGLQATEYRCYPTEHRGDLLIHAGPGGDWDRVQLTAFGRSAPRWEDLPFGRIVGLVELWAVEPGAQGEWRWQLRDPRSVQPFAFRPGRRLFDVPLEHIQVVGGVTPVARTRRRRDATAG